MQTDPNGLLNPARQIAKRIPLEDKTSLVLLNLFNYESSAGGEGIPQTTSRLQCHFRESFMIHEQSASLKASPPPG
jgi:hypothetical protein